ncbi:glycoside hydrolase family 16 protein [Russula earlei]|uniref:Glycoside hydrolase family 16 protein n=1 Tax=Russula earlei TaxID=71964 RepID=A0ACC0UIY2_9AGAM|nr:glycoside hydrolase family 16 protein [Russula earlei]
MMLSLPFAVLFSLVPLAIASHHDENLRRSRHHHTRQVEVNDSAIIDGAVNRKSYRLLDHYTADDFMNEGLWRYHVGKDPNGGIVNFVSHWHCCQVRISSTKSYNGGLFIADFAAMPYGCAVWPAYWTLGPNWPNGGELDIVEGINNQATSGSVNQVTLHTAGNCLAQPSSSFSGNLFNPHCQSSPSSDAGCSWSDPSTSSFGSGFNGAGGGVFAHLVDSSGIRVWHFDRSSVPDDIDSGNPNPSSWPRPVAFLSSKNCNIGKEFHSQTLVIDTVLCGGWTDSGYGSSGCPGTCAEFVTKGSNFNNARWIINYISVYR